MLQHQQQPQMAQMYPQVHVSHFPNMMPYRQIISPVYVPQMAMPGYSSNPAYPHPSNGSSYLLMPGGSSHLSTNGLKYGIQQFKPVPTASPTGFGNFTSPAGYAINAPSVVGSVTGLEDSSRMKYKDGNLYVSNQQVRHNLLPSFFLFWLFFLVFCFWGCAGVVCEGKSSSAKLVVSHCLFSYGLTSCISSMSQLCITCMRFCAILAVFI